MYDTPDMEKAEQKEHKGKKRIKFGPHEAEVPEGLC